MTHSGGLLRATLRRKTARLALIALVTLAVVAAFAPFVANELPLAVRRGGVWRFPAMAALETKDLIWIGSVLVAIGLLLSRWRRILLLTLGGAVLGFALVHSRHVDFDSETGAETVIRAPVTGPTNIDPPAHYAGIGTPGHPLGADELGRDVLARLLYGLRLSLLVGFAATAIATALGVVLGAWAGCGGRIADGIASLVIQTSFCLPAVFVVATVQSLADPGLWVVIGLLALLRFGIIARLTRQECVRIRDQGFVLAAKGLGLSPWRVFVRHVLPNALIPVTVAAAFGVAGAILAEAGLSFLGLGVPEDLPSLGRLLSDGREAPHASHLVFLPGTLILLLILACHAIGAALRDAVDPRGAEMAS